MIYHGHIENGVVVFDEPITLPEGASVRVEAVTEDAPKTLKERLADVIGKAQTLPPDASVNVDHYLYGAPRRS